MDETDDYHDESNKSTSIRKVITIHDDDDDDGLGGDDEGANQDRRKKPVIVIDDDDVKLLHVNKPSAPVKTNTNSIQSQPLLMFHAYFFKRKENGKTPTWNEIYIDCSEQQNDVPPSVTANAKKIFMYKMYLISQTEFSIQDSIPSLSSKGIQRLRVPIRKITRNHGQKAIYDHATNKWKIPLSVYQALFTMLNSDKSNVVEGIPESQLKIVALARAAAIYKESSTSQLVHMGVPPFLASALAPYQRAGVDFILQRHGRALLADEMGLGKTIQSIAAMCCYWTSWPLLILAPSSATHHWMTEFLQWTGCENKNNIQEDLHAPCHDASENLASTKPFPAITNRDICIVSSSKENFRSNPNHCPKIVIISYNLASKMVESGNLACGEFKCIIGDESHLLKNKNSLRTKTLVPIMKAAEKLILLSGTPALSRPIELYPQISAIGNTTLLWPNEEDYIKKYCKNSSVTDQDRDIDCNIENNRNLAELHTLLTSTIMLRRRKIDILKFLPTKRRERVYVNTRDPQLKCEMKNGLMKLNEGNGVLANLKRSKLSNTSREDSSVKNVTSSVDEPDVPSQRKIVLNNLYYQAGTAKIPLLLEMLNAFIKDSSKGKLCIFAHHLAVIQALILQSDLSTPTCSCTFIRIDGATSSKDRMELVSRFQTDPFVRIAILGLTSAGVALTLTAASTIWFAELYWTPAILLQSEDRCHRIGQQSTVRCIYFVARESVDDLLWKLIEKKYSELGAFVEGKGNENMVVNQDFLDEKDAIDTWFMKGSDRDKITPLSDDHRITDSLFMELEDDEDFGRCLEELAREEITTDENIDDNDEIIGLKCSDVPRIKSSNEVDLVTSFLDLDRSKHYRGDVDVIEILDDDAEILSSNLQEPIPSALSSCQYSIQSLMDCHAEYDVVHFMQKLQVVLPQTPLPDLRLYRFVFPQNFPLCTGLLYFCGRFVNTRRYTNASGESCRPVVGAVVVAIQGRILHSLTSQRDAERFISIAEATFQSHPYVEIIFGEDPLFPSLLDIYNHKKNAAS